MCFSTLKTIVFFFSFCSQYFHETILNEIRKARELYTGMELAAELNRIQQRLDNVECLSVDIVINLLLTYRDIQVEKLPCVYIYVHGPNVIKSQPIWKLCHCDLSPILNHIILPGIPSVSRDT